MMTLQNELYHHRKLAYILKLRVYVSLGTSCVCVFVCVWSQFKDIYVVMVETDEE